MVNKKKINYNIIIKQYTIQYWYTYITLKINVHLHNYYTRIENSIEIQKKYDSGLIR